jgi:hypothetical protein
MAFPIAFPDSVTAFPPYQKLNMEAGLVISPRFAAQAATANASFEKAHNGNLVEFPAFELRNFDMREPIFSEGEASAYFFDRRRGRTSPSRGVRLTAAMFHEIHRPRDLATSLGRKTAAERLAGFLLAMTPDDADGEAPIELILPVSRPEIADHVGLVVETVCRNLTLLKRKGFIRVEGNFGLTILDPGALRRIAAGRAPRDCST